MRFEQTLLRHLFFDESFLRRTIPYLKKDYFRDPGERIVFTQIAEFVEKYNAPPTREAIHIDLGNKIGLSEGEHKSAADCIDSIEPPEEVDSQWLLDRAEQFCQDEAIYTAIKDGIAILDGKDKTRSKDMLPEIMQEALGVSFDSKVGHDWLADSGERFKYYHDKTERIPFDIEYLNRITRGGFKRKTLNVLLAGTGVGKTMSMAHMAAFNLVSGKNVLYITNEISEYEVGMRIDANLLNVPIEELEILPEDSYEKKMARVRSKTTGRLFIKEYPTGSAHVGHFRHLLNELRLKKKFVPDIIYIDYLNICASSRVKQGPSVNSYTYVKNITEEVRGLAVEKNVVIVSATQLNRTGFTDSDAGMEHTSESFGMPMTLDFFLAMLTSETLEQLNQIACKQLKSRYRDIAKDKKFIIGVDKSKQRLYDVSQAAQESVNDDPAVMDKTSFGERDQEDRQMKWRTKKSGGKDFSALRT